MIDDESENRAKPAGDDSSRSAPKTWNRLRPVEFLIDIGLFLLALLPRAYELSRFVTADEAKWVYRSAQFLAAFLQGDFAATSVNLTPAVTTTWLGSLGLTLYYQLNQLSLETSLLEWLTSLPEFRTELAILAATRWPMVILTSLGVVVAYRLMRWLVNPTMALVAAGFIALEPQFVALSRVLGHDAPAVLFMYLSLLLLLITVRFIEQEQRDRSAVINIGSWRLPISSVGLALSGLMAGLAFLSKAPALFLLPFTGLVIISKVWRNSHTLYPWFKRFLLWAAVAYLTFVGFWPAAWVDPLGRPLAVMENAFLSATDQEEAEEEGYWLVPELGPAYYLVNGAFKLSPLVMMGVILAIFFLLKNRHKREARSTIVWLFIFSILFTVFMTMGDKRSPRYILPVFPPLALMAAFGWLELYQAASSRYRAAAERTPGEQESLKGKISAFYLSPFLFPGVLILSAFLILLPYAPYYLTYFNPLLGGGYTAPHLVKIGWGEGMDQVGRFLQRNAPDSRVGTAYASTVAPFFSGDLSSVTGPALDYVVFYRKQLQSGRPFPSFIRYFERIEPVFSVNLNGIDYADIYPGPAIQPALTLTPGLDHVILPKPIGFRPLTPYGHLGEKLEVDVLWLADDPLPADPVRVTLEPITAFDFLAEDNHLDGTPRVRPPRTILAQGEGRLAPLAEHLIVSRHQLPLPPDLARGLYALLVDGRPLGEIELRSFQIPEDLNLARGLIFGEQIALTAYALQPTEDYMALTIAWQAQKSYLPNYTVFVQLLDAETNQRLAGIDTQPVDGTWPTSRWVKNEVVVDEYVLAIPPTLPPGSYKLIAGLYRPQTGERLTLANGQDYWTAPWTLIWEE